jgi:hypothetical protein
MSHTSVSNVCAVLGAFATGMVIGWVWSGPSARSASNRIPNSAGQRNVATVVTNVDGHPPLDSARTFTDRLNKVLTTANGLKRTRAASAIADGLDIPQIREAFEAMQRIHIPQRQAIWTALISRWAELDPQGAFAHALEKNGSAYVVMKIWAENDLAAAREALSKISEDSKRKGAIAGLIEALAESDPKQAFELVEKTETYSDPVEMVFENWVEQDPEEAASHAAKLPRGFQRQAAIRAVTTRWAESNLENALQWAESLPESDVTGKAGYGDGTPVALIVANWMDKDPESALRWIKERSLNPRTANLLAASTREVFFKTGNPMLSAQIVLMLQPGEPRNNALGNLIRWWGDNDLDGAITWATEQSGDVQAATIPSLAGRLAETDPEKALDLASNLGDAARAKAFGEIVSAWAHRNPAAAAEWLQGQPPNAEQLKRVAYAWVQKDVNEATEWINTLEDGATKDQVLSDVATRLQSANPLVALAWIAGIGDEQQRNQAYKDAVYLWLVYDPAAARKWLSTAPLAEDLRAELLKDAGQ